MRICFRLSNLRPYRILTGSDDNCTPVNRRVARIDFLPAASRSACAAWAPCWSKGKDGKSNETVFDCAVAGAGCDRTVCATSDAAHNERRAGKWEGRRYSDGEWRAPEQG